MGHVGRVRASGERKNMLNKHDMARDKNTTRENVETAISLMFIGITRKNARKRSWG